MSAVIDAISAVLGFIMRGCYNLFSNYGVSIIFFTLATKVILFPVNIFIQKNSIRMVKLQPELNALKIRYIDDKDKYADEQLKLYKKYRYHPSLGIIPMIFQLVIVMGVMGVVYRPITYLLGASSGDIELLGDWLKNTMHITDAGSSAQIRIIELLQGGAAAPEGLSQGCLDGIMSFKMNFLGLNLGDVPKLLSGISFFILPVIAGLSALTLCIAQNKINVLQLAAGKFNRYATTIFMVAFSTYFAFLVPHGVGVYWICGNLFAIIPMIIINIIIPPKKYVDLGYLKRIKEERIAKEEKYRKYHKKERADYKRFFKNGDVELVFYSEANGFYKYYKDTIDYICQHSDVAIHYVTSDPEDKIFEDTRENIHAYFIARDAYLIPFFMKLSCKVVVMTTPDLEKYHIKRSRVNKNIEYIYVEHGIGSVILTARKGCLDWFDTVFVTTKDIVEEIREMEEFYKTPKKLIVQAGYPVLDTMTREYEGMSHEKHDVPQIVIAPSWQPDNIIELCGEELIDKLSDKGYDVTLRPHPQQVKHSPELFAQMQEKYADKKNITIQTDFSSNTSMLDADVLITDWSCISCEYAFATKKPVLFVDTPMKILNSDYDKFKTPPNNIVFRSLLGEQIAPDKLDNVGEVIADMLENREKYARKIDETYHDYVFNIGISGKVCARYILKSLGKI